jgi:pSer/pThr/pTyr-binding forkhead associated (FHA) protein
VGADAVASGPALRIRSTSGGAERLFPLRAGRSLIGRAPDSDIVLDAAGVSRFHAVVVVDGSSCTVEDLNSANGTAINGERAPGARALRPGDVVAVGDCVLEFLHVQATVPARHAAGS